jgi:asparagine synthase (glutamine-hydrolysing)
MMLSELSSKHVRVVLTGEGSDEIFGAYGWFHADKYLRPLAFLPLFVRRMMLLGPVIPRFRPEASRIHLAPREMNAARYRTLIGPPAPEFMHQLLTEETRDALERMGKAEEPVAVPNDFDGWHPFNQLQYYEIKLRLPDFVIRDLDRTSMAHSVEARVPFLDHELAEFCVRIPPSLKMRGLNEKYILRRALRTILPKEILRRKKRGLRAPFKQWLQEKIPEFAQEMLSEGCLKKKGYFDPDSVERLITMHRNDRGDFAKHLMAVLVIQLWDEIFLRNMKREPIQ